MKLASHNSFTYAKPVGLFSKIFRFAGRCQRINIKKQYEDYNIRLFDLRIFPKDNSFIVQHGPITFSSDELEDNLSYLNEKGDTYIRVILEQNTIKKNQIDLNGSFVRICRKLEEKYPNIKFISGRRKCDWEIIYRFKNEEPSMTDLYSSTTNLFKHEWLRKIDDLWPWLYAKLRNKKNLAKEYNTEFLMIDFVDIQ